VRREKWKNQTKWSTTTRTQEAMKEWEVREMSGHESEKFWRYMTWQRMENAILCAGSESVIASKTCIAMMAWPQNRYQHNTYSTQVKSLVTKEALICGHVSALQFTYIDGFLSENLCEFGVLFDQF
jgi:hypothetical protein